MPHQFCIKRSTSLATRDVAQPGRVLVWGTSGRRFKSCHPDNIQILFILVSLTLDESGGSCPLDGFLVLRLGVPVGLLDCWILNIPIKKEAQIY